jgi:hypothetical protein
VDGLEGTGKRAGSLARKQKKKHLPRTNTEGRTSRRLDTEGRISRDISLATD